MPDKTRPRAPLPTREPIKTPLKTQPIGRPRALKPAPVKKVAVGVKHELRAQRPPKLTATRPARKPVKSRAL